MPASKTNWKRERAKLGDTSEWGSQRDPIIVHRRPGDAGERAHGSMIHPATEILITDPRLKNTDPEGTPVAMSRAALLKMMQDNMLHARKKRRNGGMPPSLKGLFGGGE